MRYLVLILLIGLSNLKAQKYIPNKEYQTTWKYANLKGKVKKVTTKYYSKISSDSTLKVWRSFTKDSIDQATFFISSCEIEFDINGRKQAQTTEFYDFKNSPFNQFVDSLEIPSNPIPSIPTLKFMVDDSTNHRYNLIKGKHQYYYDSLNRLIKVEQVSKNNIFGYGADFIYDKKGNLSSSKFWGSNNTLLDAYDNKYDKNDSLIEIEHYNYRITEFSIEKCKYFGNKSKFQYNLYLIDGRNLYCTKTFETDENGSISFNETHTHRCNYRKSFTKQKINKYGVLEYLIFCDRDGKIATSLKNLNYKVDGGGRITEIESLDEIKNVVHKSSNEYKFDNYGNLTYYLHNDNHFNLHQYCITSYEYY